MHSCEYEAAHLEFFDPVLVSKIPFYSFISACVSDAHIKSFHETYLPSWIEPQCHTYGTILMSFPHRISVVQTISHKMRSISNYCKEENKCICLQLTWLVHDCEQTSKQCLLRVHQLVSEKEDQQFQANYSFWHLHMVLLVGWYT